MHFFTSVTANYISKARVLGKTLKKYNPDCFFILALSDSLPEDFHLEDEPFDDVIFTDQLSSIENPKIFFFKYNITEICTAVKPATALEIMDKYHAEKVCYLDPDIAVFSELSELETLLDTYSMVFTPHTTVPEDNDYYIIGNEILFLKRGTNNLGFFAVKSDEEGRRFLKWWDMRLRKFCADDDCALYSLLEEHGFLGTFTDQKWIDLVPSFFDNYYILKHPGYNVSTWNLSHRCIDRNSDGVYLVNGMPLRFFHFSGVDSGAHEAVLDQLIRDYPDAKNAKQLSLWYKKQSDIYGQREAHRYEWKYARYSNGELIPKIHRKILLIRRDLYSVFENPFLVTDELCFYKWVREEYGQRFPIVLQAASVQQTVVKHGPLFRFIKRIITLVFPKDSSKYLKLKHIWQALCS